MLEVKIQHFGARGGMRIKVFIFQKFQGPKYTSTTKIFKFEFLKTIYFDPSKSAFWVFKDKNQTNVFFVVRLWLRFKNNRRANVLLVGIFENAPKKYY